MREPKQGEGWRSGPMPPDTYGWGGVVPTDLEGEGFFFADFWGDKVKVQTDPPRELKPDEVKFYNNGLSLPPRG